MWAATAGLPEQVEAAVVGRPGADRLPQHERVENVVVLGMGGSGIAGDVLVAAAAPFMPVPVTVVKGYEPPDFVGTGFAGLRHVVLRRHRGDAGGGRRCLRGRGVAGRGGRRGRAGQPGRRVGRAGGPGARPTSPSPGPPSGPWPSPRWWCWRRSGCSRGRRSGSTRPSTSSGRRRDELVRPGNRAEELARRIGRTIPLIHSSGDLGAAAALRWKTQINENAKCPAFFNVYPELCHNEVAGWGQHGDVTRQLITLVNLRHDAEHPQVSRRFDLVAEVLREVVADVIEVRAAGEGDLAQLFDLALIGDFVSLHLAGHEGIDPGPIPVLDEIKQQLKAGDA